MQDILNFLWGMMLQLFDLLNNVSFELAGFTVYYGWLLIALIISGFIVSIFWKGAKG